jgi:hypothetical protein
VIARATTVVAQAFEPADAALKRCATFIKPLVVAVVLFAPRAALACPVCFGQNDSPLAAAMNLGILAMLVVVVGVLAGFASFFIYLVRRARTAAAAVAQQSEGMAR